EKVYPRVVEEVLRGHPGVAEAAVVGVADPVLGEVPVAFVVPRDGTPADLATQLLQLCERELSRHQRPARIHLADSLPFTPTGKVRRDALRELATS
ncbi:MAG TPA: class I adenylate-forming enzyme family protein, partial [Actinomycetota bacterium]